MHPIQAQAKFAVWAGSLLFAEYQELFFSWKTGWHFLWNNSHHISILVEGKIRNTCTRGDRKISGLFALSQKLLRIFFQKFFLFFFKVFPTYVYTLCHLRGSFCIPSANHEVDLLLRYRFTAEIKAILVSYLFVETLFFQVWKQMKVAEGQDLGCTEDGTTITI